MYELLPYCISVCVHDTVNIVCDDTLDASLDRDEASHCVHKQCNRCGQNKSYLAVVYLPSNCRLSRDFKFCLAAFSAFGLIAGREEKSSVINYPFLSIITLCQW